MRARSVAGEMSRIDKARVIFRFAGFALAASIFFFLVLECGLRLAGAMLSRLHHQKGYGIMPCTGGGELRIACLGDSYTYGAGTNFESSYPKQLQELIGKGAEGSKVAVYNLGSPGGNSYRIFKIFQARVDEFKPHVAIVLVGTNNAWNQEGAQRFSQYSFFHRVKLDIGEWRICKLWNIFLVNARRAIKRKLPFSYTITKDSLQKDPLSQQAFYSISQSSVSPPGFRKHATKINELRQTQRSDLVIDAIKNALQEYPQALDLHVELVRLLREQGEWDAALEHGKKIVDRVPDRSLLYGPLHQELVGIYRAKGEWNLAREEMKYAVKDMAMICRVFAELKAVCTESGLIFNEECGNLRKQIKAMHGSRGTRILDALMRFDKDAEIQFSVLEHDILAIAALARKKQVQFFMMTYPFSLSVNSSIRRIAARYGIKLIDNESLFRDTTNSKDFFNLDGHCNAQGYRLMAKNIVDGLQQAGFSFSDTFASE
jgi:lysophospholipase L1-like esterase